jgi:hypothetical protein
MAGIRLECVCWLLHDLQVEEISEEDFGEMKPYILFYVIREEEETLGSILEAEACATVNWLFLLYEDCFCDPRAIVARTSGTLLNFRDWR